MRRKRSFLFNKRVFMRSSSDYKYLFFSISQQKEDEKIEVLGISRNIFGVEMP